MVVAVVVLVASVVVTRSPSAVSRQRFQTSCREGSKYSRFIEHVSTLLNIELDLIFSFGGHPGFIRHSSEGGTRPYQLLRRCYDVIMTS